MRGQRGIRTIPGRLLLAVALGAMALFAIPAIGSAHNGEHHGNSDPAGTVKAFDADTGLLTIDLNDGGDISGLVVDDTRIRCADDREDNHRHGRHHRRHGHHATASDSGPGRDGSGSGDDNSGPGNSADDDSGRANEPGEDNHENGANEPGEDNHNQCDEPGEDHHNQGDEPGEDHHDNRTDRCVTQLVVGAVVARAEIDLEDGNAFFERISVLPLQEG
jgi:hypothetical protein